jgi:hypothetical protein
MAAFGGNLRKPFVVRQRIVRNCLAQEGKGPFSKQLHIGWPDNPRVPRGTRIVRPVS